MSNPISRLLYQMDSVGADLAPGITSNNDDMLQKDFLTGVNLGKAGNWPGMNRRDIADLRAKISQGNNSDDAQLRKVVSDFQAAGQDMISHLDTVQHFGFGGRGDAQDADYMASMQALKALILQFINQTYPQAKAMSDARVAAAAQAAASQAAATRRATEQAALMAAHPEAVPLPPGVRTPPGYPDGMGPPTLAAQYQAPQQQYQAPPPGYYNAPASASNDPRVYYNDSGNSYDPGAYYSDPSQDPLYDPRNANSYSPPDPFVPQMLPSGQQTDDSSLPPASSGVSGEDGEYAVESNPLEGFSEIVGSEPVEIVGDAPLLSDENDQYAGTVDELDLHEHPIAQAPPVVQAAALTRAAGNDPMADYLILGLARLEKDPGFALELAKGDSARADTLQGNAKLLCDLMRSHAMELTAAEITGDGVGAEHAGVNLGDVFGLLGGPVAGAMALLQKAFSGDTEAVAKVQNIKAAADAGDPLAQDGVATLKVADVVITADRRGKSKAHAKQIPAGTSLYQAGLS